MTGAELTAFYSAGKKIAFTSSSGNNGVVTYSPDGTTAAVVGTFTDQGKWRIKGDTICIKWKKVRGGKEGCFQSYDLGNGRLRSIDESGKEKRHQYPRDKVTARQCAHECRNVGGGSCISTSLCQGLSTVEFVVS